MKDPWNPQQIRLFAGDTMRAWGGLWPHVSGELKRALVDARVTIVLAGQDRESVSVESISWLRSALQMQLGLSGTT